jgi:hypothetical protein
MWQWVRCVGAVGASRLLVHPTRPRRDDLLNKFACTVKVHCCALSDCGVPSPQSETYDSTLRAADASPE